MLVEKVIVNFVLLIIYVLVFGQQSLQRFLDKSAVITKHEEDASLYSSPGLVFSILYLLKQFLLDVEQYCTTFVSTPNTLPFAEIDISKIK